MRVNFRVGMFRISFDFLYVVLFLLGVMVGNII